MNKSFFGEHNIDEQIRNKFFSDYSYKGTIVEVGGATPEFISMSKHFKLNGWRSVIVEPNPIFCQQHRNVQNEVYQYACGEKDENDVDFVVVHANSGKVTDHSLSSFKIKESYRVGHGTNWVDSLPKTHIKVNVRTLDSIIKESGLLNIDILTIDTEGWELEVMRGLSLIKPTIVVLENVYNDENYHTYMCSFGYSLDFKSFVNEVYVKIK